MITIISGTNRRNSECLKFAEKYQEILQQLTDQEVKLLALENIPHDWFFPEMYEEGHQAESLMAIQNEYLLSAEKLVYITPEYNGSFPGAVKLFIDACSVRKYKATFKGKKAALVGIATGRAGNLRGMDHLTGVLHHVGSVVLPNKLPISRIGTLMDKDGNIAEPATLEVIRSHAMEVITF